AVRVADGGGRRVLDELPVPHVHERLEIDQARVAGGPEVARLVEDVGDASRHAGGEVAAGAADDHHPPARHVLAAVVADAFHHGEGPAVAHGEALAGYSAEVGLAAGGPVQHHVAHEDVGRGGEGRLGRGEGHELAPGEALAHVVIGVAFQGEGDAPRHEGGEALPGRAEEVDADGVVREAVTSVPAGHFGAEDGPH